MYEGWTPSFSEDLKLRGEICASGLKARAWSRAMVKEFLTPMCRELNPYNPIYRKIPIYRLEDVERAETTPEFQGRMGLKKERRVRAKAALERKRKAAEKPVLTPEEYFADQVERARNMRREVRSERDAVRLIVHDYVNSSEWTPDGRAGRKVKPATRLAYGAAIFRIWSQYATLVHYDKDFLSVSMVMKALRVGRAKAHSILRHAQRTGLLTLRVRGEIGPTMESDPKARWIRYVDGSPVWDRPSVRRPRKASSYSLLHVSAPKEHPLPGTQTGYGLVGPPAPYQVSPGSAAGAASKGDMHDSSILYPRSGVRTPNRYEHQERPVERAFDCVRGVEHDFDPVILPFPGERRSRGRPDPSLEHVLLPVY